MPGRVNFRLDDTVARAFEEAADAREQVALVPAVDHDLYAVATWTQSCPDDGGGSVGVGQQHAGVPYDFMALVAQEIAFPQLAP